MTDSERDNYDLWTERAAIIEYDAKVSRDEAERQAKAMVVKTEPVKAELTQKGLWT